MTHDLQQLPERINPSALGRLQLSVCELLHPAGAVSAPIPRPSRDDAGGYHPLSWRAQTLCHLGVRAAGEGETPLSAAEVEHGVAHGLLGPGDGEDDDGHGFVRGAA